MKALKISKPRSKGTKICAAVCTALLAVFLILLVLGLTVYRPRHAITTVKSVRLVGVKAGFNAFTLDVDLNATILLDISTTNPNPVSFTYPGGGSAELYYRGTLAGEAEIPPGEIGARETVRSNVRLTVLAGRLVANSNVYGDLLAGTLPLTTYTRIAGKVTVMGSFKIYMVTYSTCDLVIDVNSRSVSSMACKYKTKL